jgi:hypothetical protein
VPWLDNGTGKGVGDAFAALKWRFWEKEPWSLGVRAGVTFPTGDEQRDLGNGRNTWAALLIGQYQGERWIFLSHVGYKDNRNSLGNRESIGEISAAVLYKATASLKLLVDTSRTTNTDPASRTALHHTVFGVIVSASKDIDLDAGFRRGNDAGIDSALMLGITLRW